MDAGRFGADCEFVPGKHDELSTDPQPVGCPPFRGCSVPAHFWRVFLPFARCGFAWQPGGEQAARAIGHLEVSFYDGRGGEYPGGHQDYSPDGTTPGTYVEPGRNRS